MESSTSPNGGNCIKCGNKNEYTKIICDFCGARLPWAAAAQAPVPTPAPVVQPPTVQPPAPKASTSPAAIIAALVIVFIVVPTSCTVLSNSGSVGPMGVSLVAPRYSAAQYNQLTTGMTVAQAQAIMGDSGEQVSRVEMMGIVSEMYSWANGDGSSCNAQFQDDKLLAKGQLGLR